MACYEAPTCVANDLHAQMVPGTFQHDLNWIDDHVLVRAPIMG